MYPEELVAPMRQELVDMGFKELKNAQEVDDILEKQTGTEDNGWSDGEARWSGRVGLVGWGSWS